jgi:hypothetical protein
MTFNMHIQMGGLDSTTGSKQTMLSSALSQAFCCCSSIGFCKAIAVNDSAEIYDGSQYLLLNETQTKSALQGSCCNLAGETRSVLLEVDRAIRRGIAFIAAIVAIVVEATNADEEQ